MLTPISEKYTITLAIAVHFSFDVGNPGISTRCVYYPTVFQLAPEDAGGYLTVTWSLSSGNARSNQIQITTSTVTVAIGQAGELTVMEGVLAVTTQTYATN